MNLPLTNLSEDEQLFKAEIASFAKENITPLVHQMDEKQQIDKSLVTSLFEMGLMGIEVPEELGGSEGSFFMAILAIEELSKVDPSVGVFVDVQNTLVNNIFTKFASKAQKEKYFPLLAQKKIGCFCLTEESSGSDAFALKCKAEKKLDKYIIDGKKLFITNANEAEIFIVFATVDASLGYKGVTAFILEKSMPGLSIGKKEDKLGIRASSTCEVIFDKVEVPEANLLGEVGKGYKIAIETLNEGRIGIAAQMLGLATGAFEKALQYSEQRSQFGKSINSFQGIQFQLAQMAIKIEAARLMVYNAARMKDNKQTFIKEAAMAKYFVSTIAEEVASTALEVFGGYGFTKEFPMEKFYRDVKIGKIYEGTSNLQLQTVFKLLH